MAGNVIEKVGGNKELGPKMKLKFESYLASLNCFLKNSEFRGSKGDCVQRASELQNEIGFFVEHGESPAKPAERTEQEYINFVMSFKD